MKYFMSDAAKVTEVEEENTEVQELNNNIYFYISYLQSLLVLYLYAP